MIEPCILLPELFFPFFVFVSFCSSAATVTGDLSSNAAIHQVLWSMDSTIFISGYEHMYFQTQGTLHFTVDSKVDSKVGFQDDPVEVLGPKTGHLLEHRRLLRRNHLVTAGGADLPDTEPWDAQLCGSCSFTRSAVSILCTKSVGEQARSHDFSEGLNCCRPAGSSACITSGHGIGQGARSTCPKLQQRWRPL